MRTRPLAAAAMLSALALIIGYIEQLIPIAIAVPGIKLGLSNTAVLIALYTIGPAYAAAIALLKAVLSGLLFSGVSAMAYSLAGSALALCTMLALRSRAPVIGVSIASAAAHNVGQLALSLLFIAPRAALAYLPVLLLAGAAAGAVTGLAAKLTLRFLPPQKG